MPMPIYPAAMSPLPPSMTVPVRWQPLRVTAAVLAFVALVLVVASSFLPLYEGELTIDVFDETETLEVTFTPWELDYSREELEDAPGNEIPKTGYPIVFAAVALAFAAAACWYAATPDATRTANRVAGVATSIGSAFLIGTFWTIAILVSTGVNNIIMLGTSSSGLETDATYLAGYWLLLIASLASFVAAVLSLIPARQPAWQPPQPVLRPVNPYVPTPPYGLALPMTAQGPVVAPLTGQPAPPGPASPPSGVPVVNGAVDPLTGQPLTVVDPLTGLPLTAEPPPAGVPAVRPFTPEPVGPVNGVPAQATEPPPVELPAAPAPEPPPGPAIPATEDPLAEPPRT
jgi:hypothetical protein